METTAITVKNYFAAEHDASLGENVFDMSVAWIEVAVEQDQHFWNQDRSWGMSCTSQVIMKKVEH